MPCPSARCPQGDIQHFMLRILEFFKPMRIVMCAGAIFNRDFKIGHCLRYFLGDGKPFIAFIPYIIDNSWQNLFDKTIECQLKFNALFFAHLFEQFQKVEAINFILPARFFTVVILAVIPVIMSHAHIAAMADIALRPVYIHQRPEKSVFAAIGAHKGRIKIKHFLAHGWPFYMRCTVKFCPQTLCFIQ